MDDLDIQRLLTAAQYYQGALDGIAGRRTKTAVTNVLRNNAGKISGSTTFWNWKRKAIAAAQIILNASGYEAGTVDGLYGHNTENAFDAWAHYQQTGKKLVVSRAKVKGYQKKSNKVFNFPHQRNVRSFYGDPNRGNLGRFGKRLPAPWPMVLAWDTRVKVKSLVFHEKCYDAFGEATEEIRSIYGVKELVRLNMNLHGGTHNHRRMRGGRSWSMHAYLCAWDFFPAGGGLHQRKPYAVLSRPEYDEMFDTFEKYDITSLGRAIGRDYMHVQAADI